MTTDNGAIGQIVEKLYERASREDDDQLFEVAEVLSTYVEGVRIAPRVRSKYGEITEFEKRMSRRVIALLSVRHGEWRPFMALREYHKIVDAIEYDYNQLVKGKVDA